MNSERWRQIDSLLDQILELPVEQRAGFIDNVCAGDAELRADIEAVLGAQKQSGFLDQPALKVLAEQLVPEMALPAEQMENHDAVLIGATVSRYRILERLGSGGVGVVYKAEDVQLKRFVALKFLSEEYAKDRLALERFRLEARVVAALDHPNICAIYDIGETEGRCFIVMPLLEGQTLSDRISGKPLSLREITDFAIQLAGALDKAHLTGIVHRDLKPGNIFITKENQLKILDFGLAQSLLRSSDEFSSSRPEGHRLTQPGMALGTLSYMSPEQSRGQELDHRTDLFSFGAVLYEMATGRPAFDGNGVAILHAVLHEEPVSPLALNPQVPPRLTEIITRALEKDRDTRYQTAADLQADLKRLKRETEPVSVSSFRLGKRNLSRRTVWAVLAGTVLLSVLIAWIVNRNDVLVTPAFSERRLKLFLSSPQIVLHASLSADSKAVVYVGMDEDQSDIYVSRAAGGGRVRVTDDAANESQPRFSPDGEKIVFVRAIEGQEQPQVCVTPSFGGPIVPIINNGMAPAWSPDGSRIAFIRPRPPALAVADANGENVRIVLEADTTNTFLYEPSWSPDGSQLAVVRSMGGGTGEIWTVPAAGGSARRVWFDSPGISSRSPVFTPDGAAIVHSSNRAGATNLWLMFLDGQSPVRLTSGAGPDESPSIGRDGTIAFYNSRYRYALVLSDLESGKTRELVSHAWAIWAPSFSPAGDEVAFSRDDPDGQWRIWTVPVHSGAARPLATGSLPVIYPRFTPDGDFVTYFTWTSKPDRVWKIPRLGGQATAITPERNEDDTHGDVSPDGRWLAFARTEGDMTRVNIAPVDGGSPRLLTQSPSTVPKWSADGKWIAFSPDRSFTGGVFVIAADGTGQRQLTKTGGWPTWWPDGKSIGYISVRPDGNQEIQIVSRDGGKPVSFSKVKFDGTNHPFDVSSKGQLVTSNSIHLTTEIWLMEPGK